MASSSAVAATLLANLRDIPNEATNELNNPLRNQDNYPVAFTYNGSPAVSSATGLAGVSMFVADWGHYGAVFVAPSGLGRQTTFNNYILYPYIPFEDSTFSPDPVDTSRVLKTYGWGSLLPSQTTVSNTVVRGGGTADTYIDQYDVRTAGHATTTVASGLTSTSSMDNSDLWTHEAWTQWVDVPDGTTHVTFGVTVKVPADDQLRQNNWGGFYVWQDLDTAGSIERWVSYAKIRNSTNTNLANLPVGTVTGGDAEYNWNIYQDRAYNVAPYTCLGINPTTTNVTLKETIDQEDLNNFTTKSYQVPLETTGTGRKLGYAVFFAENAKYRYDLDSEQSGAILFYNPFITFQTIPPVSTSGPVATIGTKVVSGYGLMSDPLNTTFSTFTDGSGSGATLTCTSSTKNAGTELWRVDDFVVNAVGTGYAVGDKITMNLGFPGGPYSTCLVVTIS